MSSHLIGAYGMFWSRESVAWDSPRGWQLLGCRGKLRPSLRVCDFRRAAGFYVLWDDFRATYVGLARGNDGIGARLRMHDSDPDKRWSRFSWFSFDDAVDSPDLEGWMEPDLRDSVENSSIDMVLRESEALLITVLGTYTGGSQRRMKFNAGEEWRQVTATDFAPGGVCTRVDLAGFTDKSAFDEWVE